MNERILPILEKSYIIMWLEKNYIYYRLFNFIAPLYADIALEIGGYVTGTVYVDGGNDSWQGYSSNLELPYSIYFPGNDEAPYSFNFQDLSLPENYYPPDNWIDRWKLELDDNDIRKLYNVLSLVGNDIAEEKQTDKKEKEYICMAEKNNFIINYCTREYGKPGNIRLGLLKEFENGSTIDIHLIGNSTEDNITVTADNHETGIITELSIHSFHEAVAYKFKR